MPTYQFEAMDATGQEIRDEIDAANEEEAQTTIRQMGYFVTKISVKKQAASGAGGKKGRKRGFGIGGAKTKHICAFTRQLSILQDAGLPILRSLKILENNQKPGKLKNALMDVCEEIEGGATLSEAMSKCPKVFSRLYVNMIKAGEAGGALETILQRLADFLERSESLKRKVKGALIYPVIVILVATLILTFIMIFIVPTFETMFEEFGLTLPPTILLIAMSNYISGYWFLLIAMPIVLLILVKLMRKFRHGRMGFDMFILKVPIFGSLIEKNILARTTRTLGTLVSSGVPILEAINITRETAGNAMFERMFTRVNDSIREGEVISKPLREYSVLGFHPMAFVFWALFGSAPGWAMMSVALTAKGTKLDDGNMVESLTFMAMYAIIGGAVLACLWAATKIKSRVVDDLVVNMVDVGEETGELDTMLYKVADTYDEEVKVMTDGLTALMEPLMIVFLGLAVGFIVISLFMPLVELITGLT